MGYKDENKVPTAALEEFMRKHKLNMTEAAEKLKVSYTSIIAAQKTGRMPPYFLTCIEAIDRRTNSINRQAGGLHVGILVASPDLFKTIRALLKDHRSAQLTRVDFERGGIIDEELEAEKARLTNS